MTVTPPPSPPPLSATKVMASSPSNAWMMLPIGFTSNAGQRYWALRMRTAAVSSHHACPLIANPVCDTHVHDARGALQVTSGVSAEPRSQETAAGSRTWGISSHPSSRRLITAMPARLDVIPTPSPARPLGGTASSRPRTKMTPVWTLGDEVGMIPGLNRFRVGITLGPLVLVRGGQVLTRRGRSFPRPGIQ